METAILEVLFYFSQFSYPVTESEIFEFLGILTIEKKMQEKLDEMTGKGNIIRKREIIASNLGDSFAISQYLYTLPQYSIFFKKRLIRQAISYKKYKKAKQFVKILEIFPWFAYIAISGSLAMQNTEEKDDIDIFIISEKNKIWLARITALITAQLMGLRRRRGLKESPNSICLNLFFDGIDIVIPKKKQNLFVAHELLQSKSVGKCSSFREILLWQNRWIQKYFPNIQIKKYQTDIKYTSKFTHKNIILEVANNIAGKIQMTIIQRHKTNEYITSTQLWFFHPSGVTDCLEKLIMVF